MPVKLTVYWKAAAPLLVTGVEGPRHAQLRVAPGKVPARAVVLVVRAAIRKSRIAAAFCSSTTLGTEENVK